MKFLFIVAISMLFPTFAWAWGLSEALNHPWGKARLVFSVMNGNSINYCLQIADTGLFQDQSISQQIEKALHLWLEPLRELGIHNTIISRVSCDSPLLNLWVKVGPDADFPSLYAYNMEQKNANGAYTYTKVTLNTAYIYNSGSKQYGPIDFIKFANNDLNRQKKEMDLLSLKQMTLAKFSATRNIDWLAVYYSTYKMLIHEFGHSFGLCDDYSAQAIDSCDSKFSSRDQPPSIMRDAKFFYLTGDDIIGIRRLFARYLSPG